MFIVENGSIYCIKLPLACDDMKDLSGCHACLQLPSYIHALLPRKIESTISGKPSPQLKFLASLQGRDAAHTFVGSSESF